MSGDDSDIDIDDIDLDDEELIRLQYKQKGIQHPSSNGSSNRVIAQSPKHYKPELSLLCSIDAKMNPFKPQIKYVNELSDKTKQAIAYYTDDGYDKINNYMRYPSGKYVSQVHDSIKLIDKAFENSPPLTQDVVVYRGIRSSYQIEGEFVEKAFTSTSVNLSIALEFNNNSKCCIFKINVPKGKKVLPLVNCSENASELEVLLPKNSSFKIKTVVHDKETNRNIIELKMM